MYGQQGLFLSSVASLALLTITSHHHLHRSHNTLTLHQSSVISRLTPSLAHQHVLFPSHGTRITVRDLFGNLPVRRKNQYSAANANGETLKEWGTLKKDIVGLLLAWGSDVEVVVRDNHRNKKIVLRRSKYSETLEERWNTSPCVPSILTLTQSLLVQASYVPLRLSSMWISLCGSNSMLSINGAISLAPAPTKHVQFISLGIEPLSTEIGNSIIFDEVNRLFGVSTFGNLDNDSEYDLGKQNHRSDHQLHHDQTSSGKQLRTTRRGVDKWPMFFLRIDNHEGRIGGADTLTPGGTKSVLELLQVLIKQFLLQHGFGGGPRPTSTIQTVPSYLQDPDSLLEVQTCKVRPRSCEVLDTAFQSGNSSNSRIQDATGDDRLLKRQHSQSRKRPRFQSDDLGSGVIMPDFGNRRLCNLETDFVSWSKMKKGKSSAPSRLLNPLRNVSDNTSAKSAPYDKRAADQRGSPGPSYEHFQNLDNGSDMKQSEGSAPDSRNRTRASFDQPSLLIIEKDVSDRKMHSQTASDGEVSGINPYTKVEFRFKRRTGFVVSPVSCRPTSSPVALGRAQSDIITAQKKPSSQPKPGTNSQGQKSEVEPSNWIKGVLANWENPVFLPTKKSIPQLSVGGVMVVGPAPILRDAHQPYSSLDGEITSYDSGLAVAEKISRDALKEGKVIAQVDDKFILMKIAHREQGPNSSDPERDEGEMLVIIDQHAADERCRVESLLAELCTAHPPKGDSPKSSLGLSASTKSVVLDKPIIYQVSEVEYPLYQKYAPYFARWGILYDLLGDAPILPQTMANTVSVMLLPVGIAERCRTAPELLIQTLRSAIWDREDSGSRGRVQSGANSSCKLAKDAISAVDNQTQTMSVAAEHPWLGHVGNCPRALLGLLNSRACRSTLFANSDDSPC